MALKVASLRKLAKDLETTIKGERLSRFVQYDDDVFFVSLSRHGRLCFVINNQDPYVYLSSEPLEGNSLSSNFSALLRKKVSGAEILSICLLNKDRILDFHLRGVNELFKEEEMHLLLELIPTKANIILTDEDMKIQGALRTNYITDPHPIFRGAIYLPPENPPKAIDEDADFDFEEYNRQCIEKEDSISSRRQRTQFQAIYRLIATKRKSAKRKIAMIEADIEKAKRHLSDGDYGNFIYMNMDAIDSQSGSMDYYGTVVALDKRLSNVQNAEAFFKAAKKAKTALALGEENLRKAKAEAEEYERLQKTLSLCDESALEKLAKEYGLALGNKNEVDSPLKEGKLLPYRIDVDGMTILFGKTSRENDFLSFLYKTDKDYLWFHPKDQKGSHLILCTKDASPKQKQLCCELVLAASGLEEGEVIYTTHRNIRRGSVPGLAILKNYESALIRLVPEESKNLVKQAQKIKI